ncbi:unnamed protein product [Phytophthora fragariaefolia]|uniref:Unnamed protein product n=1 Tax=Phytophthora fragariaefolia TaxID=1490495 RepID=A0A9W7CYF0_9STRA|nr:unnamed protein product [Phytophthora fragariaefolia]
MMASAGASAGPAALEPMARAPLGEPSNAPPVSLIHVALSALDRDAVRASIGQLTGVLSHVVALTNLENDHEDFQCRYRELRSRVEPLEEELAPVYAAADPLVAHCQHKYDMLLARF